MKNTLRLLTLAAAATLVSCGEEKAAEATTTAAQAISNDSVPSKTDVKIDTFYAQADMSSIGWKCSKPVSSHNGIIKISKGWLGLNAGKIEQGAFTIDMKTISDLDIKEADKNKKLVGHLSSKDFFDVASFPTSEFVLTSATDSTLTGNLTLKGKTNSITFPYTTMIKNGEMIVAKANFSIDRSKWGIEFLGKSVAGIKPNDIVSDMIELEVSLSAAAKK